MHFTSTHVLHSSSFKATYSLQTSRHDMPPTPLWMTLSKRQRKTTANTFRNSTQKKPCHGPQHLREVSPTHTHTPSLEPLTVVGTPVWIHTTHCLLTYLGMNCWLIRIRTTDGCCQEIITACVWFCTKTLSWQYMCWILVHTTNMTMTFNVRPTPLSKRQLHNIFNKKHLLIIILISAL